MARRLLILACAFCGMVAGIEGLARAVAWWQGRLSAPDAFDWLLIGGLPFVAWLWWRTLSPFGPGRGQCLAASHRCDDETN